MRKTYLASALLVIALAACGKQEQPAPAAQAPAPASTGAPSAVTAPQAPAPKPGRHLAAEDIAQIEATGKTGLWADVDQACPTGPRQRAILTWNVKATGTQKVLLYLVDKKGRERRFGQGDAVGSRQTGPWLRPGLTFKLRDAKTKSELGTLVIGKKQC